MCRSVCVPNIIRAVERNHAIYGTRDVAAMIHRHLAPGGQNRSTFDFATNNAKNVCHSDRSEAEWRNPLKLQ